MKSTTLYFREGKSDKVYQAAIEPKDNLFIVTFAYGRRGATLQAGVKTPNPVDFETAETVFNRLVREKVAKGYTTGAAGTPYENSPDAGRVSGILPQLLNPIDEAEAKRLIEDDDWCLQEKKDGRRLILEKLEGDIRGINRRGLAVPIPSPLQLALASVEGDFVLDGECIGDVFHAFDLIRLQKRCIMEMPLRARLNMLELLLQSRSSEYIRRVPTVFDIDGKRSAFEAHQTSGAEGVVFKRMDAPYTQGRPNSGGSALKFKFTATGSFIVAGVNAGRSVSLRVFDEDSILGNVTVPPNHDIPMPDSIVEVRYLYCFHGGSLFQPVYLGERDDIGPEECLVSQLKFKRKDSDDDGE